MLASFMIFAVLLRKVCEDNAMQAHFEKIVSSATSFALFERSDSKFIFNWHYHPECELTLIVDGQGQRFVGESVIDYKPGDLVLLGPNLPHSWRSKCLESCSQKKQRAIVIQFRPDFLGEQFVALEEMVEIRNLLKRSVSGLDFGHTKTGRHCALALLKLTSLSPAHRLLALLSILLDLSGEADVKVLSTNRMAPACRIEDQKRIDAICFYLGTHFNEEIDFGNLVRKFHMNPASLCRFFKRATGRTITAFVNELRVGCAAQLLTGTDQSVVEIGFNSGFGDYSNFNRQFKRIKGCAPRAFRQQFSSSPIEKSGSPVGSNGIQLAGNRYADVL
jgi:AraC-like DNA-binding protein